MAERGAVDIRRAAPGGVISQGDPPSDRLPMAWRATALLLLAGAVLTLVTLALPHSAAINDTAYLVLGLTALAAAGIVAALGRRLPLGAFHLTTACGTVLITAAIYYAGPESGGASENELLYLWPVLFSVFFFSRAGIAFQLGFLALAYAVFLIKIDAGHAGVARGFGTIFTLAATAVLMRALRERNDRDLSLQRATLESTTDGILVVDGRGRWASFNRGFLTMWKIPKGIAESGDDEVALKFVLDQLADPDAFLSKVRELYEQPDAESYDVLRFKDGRVLERYSQPQRIDGRSVGRVWSFRDVTERERSQERLRHLADHDPLTNLFNRRRFEAELDREAARAGRYGIAGAVLVLDLDHFKLINDRHGHVWGDEVLRRTAEVLQERLRRTDLVARLGGDEFAVLLPEAGTQRALEAAKGLLTVIRGLSLETGDDPIRVTTSIGVSAFSQLGDDAPEPLVAADTAMYRAKREGRDRVAVYDPKLDADRARAAPHSASR